MDWQLGQKALGRILFILGIDCWQQWPERSEIDPIKNAFCNIHKGTVKLTNTAKIYYHMPQQMYAHKNILHKRLGTKT